MNSNSFAATGWEEYFFDFPPDGMRTFIGCFAQLAEIPYIDHKASTKGKDGILLARSRPVSAACS